MLGEQHSLENDFPDFKDQLQTLMATNERFIADNKRYNALDKEIRVLEMRDSPIKDEAMHQLKHDRAELKDKLYQQLLSARS